MVATFGGLNESLDFGALPKYAFSLSMFYFLLSSNIIFFYSTSLKTLSLVLIEKAL